MQNSLPNLKPQKNKVFKNIFRLLAAACFCIAFGCLILPTLLSTSWGNSALRHLINNQISGEITYKHLNISWFGSQSVEKFSLSNNQSPIISVDELSISTPLWKLLVSGGKQGSYTVKNLQALIIRDLAGRTNLQQALETKASGHEDLQTETMTVSLHDVNAEAHLDSTHLNQLHLSGKTSQGDLSGTFSVDASIGDLETAHFLNSSDPLAKIQMHAQASNFPVALLDEALSLSNPKYRGLLLTALGNVLDLDLLESHENEGVNLNLKIQTPLVKGVVSGSLEKDRLIVGEPDSVEVIIQPALVEKLNQIFSEKSSIKLLKETRGNINLAKMQLIFDNKGNSPFLDLAQSYLAADLTIDRADLEIFAPVGAISLKKCFFSIDASEHKDRIQLNLASDLIRNSLTTQIKLGGQVDKTFKMEEFSSLKNADLRLDLVGLPIVLFDELMGQTPLLVDGLGKSVDAHLNLSYEDEPIVHMDLASDIFKMTPLQLKIYPSLELIQPVRIDYQLPHSWVNQFALHEQPIHVEKSVPVQVQVTKMHIPLANEAYKQLSNWTVMADLGIKAIDFKNLSNQETFQISDIQANLTGPSLKNSLFNIAASIHPQQNSRVIGQILGGSAQVKASSAFALDHQGEWQLGGINTSIKSPNITGQLQGRVENGKQFFLTSPASLRFNLNPESLKMLGLSGLRLEDSSEVVMSLEANQTPLSVHHFSQMQLKGLLKIDQINLYGNAGSLQKLNIQWGMDGLRRLIHLDIQGLTKLHSGRVEGSLSASMDISNWLNDNKIDFSSAQISNKTKLVNFPVAFVEKITQQEDLTALVGQAVDVDVQADMSLSKPWSGNLRFDAKNKDLGAQGALLIQNGLLINQAPIQAQLALTPDRFQAFRRRLLPQNVRQPDILLNTPSLIHLTLDKLSLPLEIQDKPSWLKASLSSHVSIDSLDMKDKETGRQVWLGQINGKFVTPEVGKEISFTLKGLHNQQKNPPLPFSLEGKASRIFNSTGGIDIDHLGLLLDSNIQQFPLKLLSQFIGLGDEITQRISATLGDTINALVHIDIHQLQGPVTANLSGSNGSIALNASVKEGILFLNQDFKSQIVLSKEFGKYVLEDIFPLASGLVGSDNPLNINIEAKGFSLPIKNFDLNRVKIETASLQMGKVRFRKEGKLGSVLSLFNTQGNQDISVWFTPLYISMKDGQMTFQRMDMLIMDAYPIATWGTVNFVKDKVNMVIGLTARALNTGLNIPGLDGDYMLQIPFKGTIDNASIDKKRATAKIAALVASNRGPEGLFIGTALRIASGELNEEKAPAPTTNPLPWQTAGDTPSSNTTNPNHPLHQVEEKATSILKNILPF